MKNFFQMFFASLLALIVAGAIMGVLFIVIVVAVIASISASTSTTSLHKHSILEINLSHISDTYVEEPWQAIFSKSSTSDNELPLSVVLAAINEAKTNDKIDGIYLNVMDPGCGYATLEAVRRQLLDFEESGKFVVSYSDMYTLKGYYLASVANDLTINPEGVLAFDGLSSKGLFYKDLLDKLGVEMMVFKVGTFKSAVEPYILNGMSEPNRAQVISYMGDIWDRIKASVGVSRSLSVDQLQAIADSLPSLQPASSYVTSGLVDRLSYQDEFLEELAARMDVEKISDLRFVSLSDVHAAISSPKGAGRVGVIFAEGEIQPELASSPLSTAKAITGSLCDQIYEMAQDDDIDAMVVRVNSPGGSSYISEQLWHAVVRAKEKKPVVISMGDYAASGGYYMSSGAQKIYAEPSTITGSIGIFGVMPNATKLANKIGVHSDGVKTAEFADLGTIDRPWRNEEKAKMQQYVNRGYQLFLKRVSDGRGMSVAAVDSIAQGRVWTGAQALSLGLVDELGGLDDAIAGAANLAKITNYQVVYSQRVFNPLAQLFTSAALALKGEFLSVFVTPDELRLIEEGRVIRSQTGLQARLPYAYEL